jgi:putative SOS response-associated peptidase YedK
LQLRLEPPPGWVARDSVSPGQLVPLVRRAPEGGRELVEVHWGLVPGWSHALEVALTCARASTLGEHLATAGAFARRRGLVIADGYDITQAAAVEPRVGQRFRRPVAMAALWERWEDESGRSFESCALVTQRSDEPVLLAPGQQLRWLDVLAPRYELEALLRETEVPRRWAGRLVSVGAGSALRCA